MHFDYNQGENASTISYFVHNLVWIKLHFFLQSGPKGREMTFIWIRTNFVINACTSFLTFIFLTNIDQRPSALEGRKAGGKALSDKVCAHGCGASNVTSRNNDEKAAEGEIFLNLSVSLVPSLLIQLPSRRSQVRKLFSLFSLHLELSCCLLLVRPKLL